MIGCRTIKCYAWENHYLEKINQIRKKQMGLVFKVNIVNSLGQSVYQNIGLIVMFVILISEWSMGKRLKTDI